MTLKSKLNFTLGPGTGDIVSLTAMPDPPVTAIHDVTRLLNERNATGEQIAAAVRRRIAPETWAGRAWWRGGIAGSLELPDGQYVLLVRNERRVLDEIARWLEELRER